MPDPYRKVAQGDPVTFSASAWNGMLDAARTLAFSRHDRFSDDRETTRRSGIVLVKNETAADLPRRAVVGLDGPIFAPSVSEEAFLRDVAFRGVEPDATHRDRFVILLEPAPGARVVRAFASGVCQARIDIVDQEHRFAVAEPGSTDRLASAASGSAQILWREGDEGYGYETGEQWAIVRLGQSSGGPALALSPTAGIAANGTGEVVYFDDPQNLSYPERSDVVTNPWEIAVPGDRKCAIGVMDGVPGLAVLWWDCAPFAPYYY